MVLLELLAILELLATVILISSASFHLVSDIAGSVVIVSCRTTKKDEEDPWLEQQAKVTVLGFSFNCSISTLR